ncbi:MAG TPA: TonB-dependent receptor [Gemmatimonadales bacterium]|nr:TonB-dependent receptor [Gemmatimonadales bacterium]
MTGPPARNTHTAVTALALACALAMLWSANAPAQIIAGTVRSGHDPVVGATVRVLELDRSLRSGARGQFAFSNVPNGRYTVSVEAIGYRSVTHVVQVESAVITLEFNLPASAFALDPVVVSASPVARKASDEYQSTASRSQVELLNSAGASFSEKISDLPGVAARLNGSAPSRPILRGLGDNEVLVLENGLRIGDIATFDPAHATPIAAAAISRIDIVRGPATVLYGPSTIGGLVNVLTDIVPAVADHPVSGTAIADLSSGSDQYSGYINQVFSGASHAFHVSAGGVHTNDIHIPSGTYVDPASGMPFTLDRMPQSFDHSSELGAGYSYQSARGSIGIGAKHYEMNYGIPGVPPNPNWSTVPPTTSRIAQDRNTVELRGLLSSGGPFFSDWKLNASYNDYGHSEFPTEQDSTGVSAPQANHFHKREFNAFLQGRHTALKAVAGAIGLWVNVEDMTIQGDQPLGPNSRTTGLAAYAYEEYKAAPGTRLQAGLRFDYNKIQTRPYPQSSDSVFRTINASRLANALTASLGAIRRFTPNVTGSISLARSFRAPTVQELFANGLDAASGTFSIGTATLGPETGLGLDASLKGSFATATFEVSPYLNTIDHYIYAFLRGDTIQNFPVRQFAATRARLAGLEGSITVEPLAGVALTASGDYVNAQDTRRNVPLPFTPPLRGLVRGSYQDGRYLAVIEGRMAARQTRLGDGDTPTAGYAVMNVGTGMRLVQHGLVHNIGIHCDNVFNTVYRDHLSVTKDFVPQPGRAFRLTYELLY